MNATTTTPTRQRGRPARRIAAAPEAAALKLRSMVYMTAAPYYSDGADVEAMHVRWREHLELTAEQIEGRATQAAAHLAEVESALSDIAARKAKAAARMEECRQAAEAHPTATTKSRTADADFSLDALAVAKARTDVAREMLPAVSAAHYALSNELRDAEKAHNDARRALRDLEAARAWQALQSALAPVQAAISEWLEATGDAAVFIGAPAAR
ncbi:hypothetical protein CBP34_15475 [Acidovorax carolinensis]|uniref:Uncharacterized protein n=1 Tax=Acidovorax carolinensis TaxID=553814 RepID=A0A240U4L2_9BURK|nr:hypothetical protein [Acidovorax carolinensis]ART52785.1 hypothetical protein CBP34_15475 [Acidovorax carolinensis]